MHPNCTNCPRNAHVAMRLDGEGPANAEALVLIEQPDLYDNGSRRPATGKAGLLLRRLVSDAGLTNLIRYEHVVRCYAPSQDRHPDTKAIHACFPFVEDTIRAMPAVKVVVALGIKAMRACGISDSAKDVYGTRVETTIAGKKLTVVPMHDALTIMHDPNLVSTWFGYWQGVKRLITAKQPDFVKTGQPAQGEALIHYPNGSTLTGFDIETNTLNPHEKSSTILSWAVASSEEARAIYVRTPKDLKLLVNTIDRITQDGSVAIHNAAFEINYLEAFAGYTIDSMKVIDTLILSSRVDPGQPSDLHSVVTRYLSDNPLLAGYKLDTGGGIKQAWTLGAHELLTRNGLDAYALPHLVPKLLARLAPEVTQDTIHEDVTLSALMGKIGQRGLHVSYDAMIALRQSNEKVQQNSVAVLRGINNRYGVDEDVNPGSPKQVGEFLTRVLTGIGSPVNLGSTLKGNYETGEIPLRILAHDVNHQDVTTAVNEIIAYRSASKTNGTNIKGYSERISHDGRLRSEMRWPGTVSWRASSSNPNLHNVPRDAEVRKLFTAPPGKIMWECDYGQIELRIAAALSQDPVLCHVFKTGGDAHTLLAQRIFYGGGNNKPTKAERDRAKTTNFGLLYGAGVRTLWEQFVKDGNFIDMQEVSKYHSTFWTTYQGLDVYVKTRMAQARAGGYLYAPIAGYRWRLADMRFLHGDDLEEACRSIFNSTIQCVPPRYTLRAARMAELDEDMINPSHGFEITHQTHDGLMGYVNDTAIGRVLVDRMKYYMDLQTQEPWWQGVPCRASAKVGPSWGELADL